MCITPLYVTVAVNIVLCVCVQVCDKSIRGDTLYKIHLTTPGHIKVTYTQHHLLVQTAELCNQIFVMNIII